MKPKSHLIRLSTLTLGAFLSFSSHAFVIQELKDYLKEQLADAPTKSKETFTLSADQKKAMTAVAERASDTSFTFYYAKDSGGKLKLACSVVPQEGKEGPMTVGVCLDSGGLVKSVRVLTMEEDHGKPVKELAWLKQFEGKKSDSAFKVGKDVDAVSGATRSSESVSEAVRKVSFAFNTFVKK
jgi:Na+-translocating ferredoxin:NAD+ oxidoreductase RnfG subunit